MMSKQPTGIILALMGIALVVLTSEAAATKYAGEPYYLGVGARALGRGGAFTAAGPEASAVFWNVAALSRLAAPEVILQHAETFGSFLNHDVIAVAMPGSDSSNWAWGAYGTYLGGDGIQLTVYDSTTNRPRVDSEAGHGDWSFGFGLARHTQRWWTWGIVTKMVIRDLPGNSAWGLGMDLAFWGEWRHGRFGMKIADLSTTFLSYDSGRKETIVPHVNWGGEITVPSGIEGLAVVIAAEAETYFEGRRAAAQYWSGSISVDLHLGLELSYRDLLFGRIGSDAGATALGVGFVAGRWGIDAALADHEFLDNSYRFSLRYMIP